MAANSTTVRVRFNGGLTTRGRVVASYDRFWLVDTGRFGSVETVKVPYAPKPWEPTIVGRRPRVDMAGLAGE